MPRFIIRNGCKFACMAINTWVSQSLREQIRLNNNIWIRFSPPSYLLRTWRRYLGSLRSQNFSECNLFILTSIPSANIAVLDDENKQLCESVTRSLYMLHLQGAARHGTRGFLISGAKRNRRLEVRSVSPVYAHLKLNAVKAIFINRPLVMRVERLCTVCEHIYNSGDDYLRLRKGFGNYIQALREGDPLERLHRLVRSIEAVTKPSVGSTTNQFRHRCQTFVCRNPRTYNILNEIYELRSRTEHLNSVDDVLTNYDENQRDNIIIIRIYQTEIMTEHIYATILSTPDILQHYVNDDTLDAFWRMRDNERYHLWQHPIDIEQIAVRNLLF